MATMPMLGDKRSHFPPDVAEVQQHSTAKKRNKRRQLRCCMNVSIELVN